MGYNPESGSQIKEELLKQLGFLEFGTSKSFDKFVRRSTISNRENDKWILNFAVKERFDCNLTRLTL